MSKKALVVDDDIKVVLIVEKVLKDLGFEVESAGDGKIAFDMIKKNKPDLLISDMLIPGIHGIELSQMIKDDPELKNIAVILMTAVYKKADYMSSSMDSKADAFVDKPIDVKTLISVVSKLRDWS